MCLELGRSDAAVRAPPRECAMTHRSGSHHPLSVGRTQEGARQMSDQVTGRSAGPARQDPEEGLNVGVGAEVAVAIEVRIARLAAVAPKARKERLDVCLGAGITVPVVIRAAARDGDHLENHPVGAGRAQVRGGAEVDLPVLVTPDALEVQAEVCLLYTSPSPRDS